MPRRHETLTELFTDIADAIRTKTGSQSEIVADNFDTAIEGIIQEDTGPSIIEGTITDVNDSSVTTVRNYAFAHCSALSTVNLPACTSMGSYAFQACTSLSSINIPVCTRVIDNAFAFCSVLSSINLPVCTLISGSAFYQCRALSSIGLPACSFIGDYAFGFCSVLSSINLPVCTRIGANAFFNCSALSTVYLPSTTICTLGASNAFSNTGIWNNKGSIYVPASLVDSYKSATNWIYFSNRVFAIEE